MGITALLNQTATLYAFSSRNAYDEPTFSAGASVKVRFEFLSKIIKSPQGEDIGCDAMVFLPLSTSPSVGDKIAFESVNYRIVAVDRAVGRPGTKHHLEAYLQKIT